MQLGSVSVDQPIPSTQKAQGQPRSIERTVSPASKKSKKHKRSASAGSEADVSTEPTQPVADYTPASPVSSPARPFQSVDTVGESIEFPLQISDNDSDSVTSLVTHLDSSSTSSDSSLSSASLQDLREPVNVDTNQQQSFQATPLSTASTPQTTSSTASPSTFPGLAIKPSALEAIC
ncbi:uncharacterized protein LOC127078549 [Lathyrus oleraceus]|uniref:uncharacterized protein LOC127078549 n=1 Tax=Pisum sativum TaxID=3888 RepID=UPI0021CE0C46|nr:uncharacterized protein LOC127078549 [Pisum sativum]